MKRYKRYDQGKGVRELARKRIGKVPASRVIVPKVNRKPRYTDNDLEEAHDMFATLEEIRREYAKGNTL